MPKPVDLTRETDVLRTVTQLYEALGCRVLRFADYGTGPKRTPPGWPDLVVGCPRKHVLWVHEAKTPDGAQSIAQYQMQALLEACGVAYVIGGEAAARAQLARVGVVVP